MNGLNLFSALKFAVVTALVVGLNAALISFFARERGVWFSLRALLFHQLYYLYSSATFAICTLRFHLSGGKDSAVTPTREPAAVE